MHSSVVSVWGFIETVRDSVRISQITRSPLFKGLREREHDFVFLPGREEHLLEAYETTHTDSAAKNVEQR